MGKRLLAIFVISLMCLGPLGPTFGTVDDGLSRSITPFDSDPEWYDALDDTSHVYVPSGGLVGVEVADGEARLLPGHDEGWIASSVISCPDGFRYDLVLLEADLPGASYVNITILNATKASTNTGFANATVSGFVNITGTDASVYRVGRVMYPQVRIQVNLVASGTDRPRLLSWSLRFINLDEWRDDFLGTGKMSDMKGLNITGGRAELNLSRGGGTSWYDKYPPVVLANNNEWLEVFYPTVDNTGYDDIEEITNADYTQNIAIDELNSDGYLDVVCAMGGDITTADCKIMWGGASGKWSMTDSYTIDTPGNLVDTGDLNGDGDVDIVLVNRGIGPGRGTGTMIFLNQGLGEFPDKPDIVFQTLYPIALATGDVDNDGYDDLMLWENTFRANLYYGGPSGPDTTADETYLDEYSSASMAGVRTVLLDDFDADGYLDVSFNVKYGNPSVVPVYLGSSSGIDDTADLELNFDNYPYTFDVGDINLDGYPDLVVSNSGGTSGSQIHIWKGASNLWTKSNVHKIDVKNQVTHLRVVDIDKDGFDDIVTVDSENLKVYSGDSSWPTTFSVSKTGVWIPTDIEVAVPKGASYGLVGSFLTRAIPIPVGKVWDILRVDADLPENTDMMITVLDTSKRPIPGLEEQPGPDLDLSVIENWRSIFVKVHIWSESNQTTPSLDQLMVNWMDEFTWRDQFYGTVKFASSLGLEVIDDQLQGSSDGRGTSDLVFADMRNDAGYGTDSLGFVDAGGLDYASIGPVRMRTVGARAVDGHDVNDDGIQDLVFASYGRNQGNPVGDSHLFLGSPTGWYEVPLHTFRTSAAMDVVMDDLNGDGHADVVFAQEQDRSGYGVESILFWGAEDGWNASPDVEFATSGASGVEAVDVDDDGLLDLVFACYRDADMTTDSLVFLQDSAGFCGTEPDHYLETVGARAVAPGDLDDDGNLDLVFACHHDGESYAVDSRVYWGQAGGGFGPVPTELPTLGAMDVEVADLDGDGHLDIVFANNRNATSGYLSEAYVYLNDGSGGFGPLPSVNLPTEGATAVEVADLDGTGHMDLVFACSNNGTTFRIPSVVYLGGAGGWSAAPDILLPTVGAMDSMAMLLSDPDTGGYISEAITPDERDDIGAFHTLSYDATLGASHSATLHVLDAKTGETLLETPVLSGPQAIDMRRAFHYQVHPSVRIMITVEGLDGETGFAIDDLRLNWTKRTLTPPEVVEAYLTNTTCYRTQTVQVLVDVFDEYDPTHTLKVFVTHQLVGTTDWSTSMRGTPVYEDGLWRVEVAPDRYAALGEYVFRVLVEDSDRMSSGELILEDTLEVLPNLSGPPVLLEASFGDSKVDLTWKAPEDTGDLPIVGYWLHRGTSEDALEQLVTLDALATTYSNEGLVNGQTYYYAILAFNDLGDSSLSNMLSATPAGLPGAPVNLVGESGDGSVTLTWEPPVLDGGMPILSYFVYRSLGDGPMEPLSDVTGMTFTDTGVTNGETYGYVLAALNALGEGPATEELYVVPMGLPDPPGDLVLEAGLESLSITWLAPLETGGGPITGYVIYRGEEPEDLGHLEQVWSDVLSFTDEDVTVGTTYHYAVAAVTDGGEGARSPTVSGVPIDFPGAPLDLVAEGGDGQVVLTWSVPDYIGGTPVTGYVVMRGFSSESLTRLATLEAVTSFTDTLVTNDETYWYAVIAINVMGEGDPTDAVDAMTRAPPTVPGKVLSLVAEVKGDRVELSWLVPTIDGGSAITGYVILRGTSRDDLEVIARPGLVLFYIDEDVKPGKTYFYSVAAVNIMGQGEDHAPMKAALEGETEAGLPVLPIALAIVAVVVILLVVLLMRRGRAAPAGDEETVTDDEEEGGDETEDDEAEVEEAGAEEAGAEEAGAEEAGVDEEGGEPPGPGEGEGEVAPEDDWSHPEIEVEYREVT